MILKELASTQSSNYPIFVDLRGEILQYPNECEDLGNEPIAHWRYNSPYHEIIVVLSGYYDDME